MLKRKIFDVVVSNKRYCRRTDVYHLKLLFKNLPNEIIIHILNFLDIVDFKQFQIGFPMIDIFTSKIYFEKNHINNKNDMLIKAFDMKNINIIEFLFNNIKYCNPNQIFISYDIFNEIIILCMCNNFFEGIDFLINWKEEHMRKYKLSKYFNNNSIPSIEDIIEEYNNFENNDTNIFEEIILNIIYLDYIDLFDYLITNYRLYKIKIIELIDSNIQIIFIHKKSALFDKFLTYNTNSSELYYENLYNLCVHHNSLECLNILLQPHNNYKFIPGLEHIFILLNNNKIDIFEIIYENNKDFYDLRRINQIFEVCISLYKIDIMLFLLNRFDGLLDYILNNTPDIFIKNMLYRNSYEKYYLFKIFGNSKYIKLDTLLRLEEEIMNDINNIDSSNICFYITSLYIIKQIKKTY